MLRDENNSIVMCKKRNKSVKVGIEISLCGEIQGRNIRTVMERKITCSAVLDLESWKKGKS